MTMEEKYNLIQEEVLKSTSKNVFDILLPIMRRDFISIHGPEHHFLDGASFLMAYKNAGGNIDIESALKELSYRTIQMPGAMCGKWGVCGSITAVGAALSIIHQTGPISSDEHYKEHMEYTSSVVKRMSEIGGPRCCKRNAFISLQMGVEFVNTRYHIPMEGKISTCEFTNRNLQCIHERCPFYKK